MLKIIPSDDLKQAKLIRRYLMSVVSYLMSVLFIFFVHYQGFSLSLPRHMLWIYSCAALATQAVFYGIFRTGFNKRFSDPSLTIQQMVVGIAWLMVVAYYASEAVRPLFLLFYLVIFIFGAFKLKVPQFLYLSLFALISYGTVVAMLLFFRPEMVNLNLEVLNGVCLGIVLFWFSFVGGYINQLREKLVEALGIIKKLATHDELTNVFNRRKLFETLQREKALADRNGTTFSICMFDLDLFKEINDTYGHLVGDTVLRIVAQAISNDLREEDYMARFGGEEFVLVLSYPELESAVKCAERLRRLTESLYFPDLPNHFRITISFGVTEYRSPELIEETLARADSALYRAKTRGRNRVEFDRAS
jgi:diguanylate cyclase (GGDEF)-like protein